LQEKKFGKFSPEEVLKYVLPEGKYTSSNKKMQKKGKNLGISRNYFV
jgi:hypothetical protein